MQRETEQMVKETEQRGKETEERNNKEDLRIKRVKKMKELRLIGKQRDH